jgi:hypothetical protein
MVSFREGDYLTDQRRLYRVVQIVRRKFRRRAAILEDCRTLDSVLFRPGELKRMRLQLVRPAPPSPRSSRRRTSVIDRRPIHSGPWTTSARRTSV